MKKYCFGIDIGGTTVKCGLFNVDGEVLDKWEIKTRTEKNGENIIADIAETMNAKIAEKGLDKEEIVGDRKSTRLNSSHWNKSRMPSSA